MSNFREREVEEHDKLEDAIKVLVKHCNIMNPIVKLDDVLDEMMVKEHRTVQQVFIKSINDFLVKYSEMRSDMRNEASVDFAKKVKELEAHFPYI